MNPERSSSRWRQAPAMLPLKSSFCAAISNSCQFTRFEESRSRTRRQALRKFLYFRSRRFMKSSAAFWSESAMSLRTPVNNTQYFPPNFEGLVLGCIDADFCK